MGSQHQMEWVVNGLISVHISSPVKILAENQCEACDMSMSGLQNDLRSPKWSDPTADSKSSRNEPCLKVKHISHWDFNHQTLELLVSVASVFFIWVCVFKEL